MFVPYSDLTIRLSDGTAFAHKLVLTARSDNWSDANLCEIDALGTYRF